MAPTHDQMLKNQWGNFEHLMRDPMKNAFRYFRVAAEKPRGLVPSGLRAGAHAGIHRKRRPLPIRWPKLCVGGILDI